MKLLIKVGDVPIGVKVTKRSGEKIYEVRDKIVIYAEDGVNKPSNEITASPGTRLLVSVDPAYSFAIVAVPETLEVLWEMSSYELQSFLFKKQHESPNE